MCMHCKLNRRKYNSLYYKLAVLTFSTPFVPVYKPITWFKKNFDHKFGIKKKMYDIKLYHWFHIQKNFPI
jgi:hypothetical protein